jgi:PAS domain S-box-containing protein
MLPDETMHAHLGCSVDATPRTDDAALRRSEAQYRELIEQAPEAVFVADLEGRYTNVNGAAERMLGYTREELVGKTIGDLIPADEVARLHAEKERLLEKDHVEVSEWTLLRKDGVRVPVEVSAKIQQDGRWIAFVRDISERKRTARELEASRVSLARAQRVARLGSWDWDLETNQVQRSDELLELFGLRPDAVSSRRLAMLEYLHPEDRDHVLELVDGAVRDGRAYSVEHRIVRADGTERIVLQQGEPIVKDGKPVRVVGTLLDITERRRAELEREASLKWLGAVVEHSPIGLLLVHGPDGERVEANSRAVQLLGRRVTSIDECEESVVDVTGAALPAAQLPSRRALLGESVEWGECRCKHPDGTLMPILVGAAPIMDANGRVEGAVVAFQDISAAKELERLRAEWGSVVAHDLRQPLNAMVLLAQYASRGLSDPDALHTLERIKAAGMRLNRMIGDLMDLSRLDARRLELARERIDVVALLRDSVARFALEAPTRRVDRSRRADLRQPPQQRGEVRERRHAHRPRRRGRR